MVAAGTFAAAGFLKSRVVDAATWVSSALAGTHGLDVAIWKAPVETDTRQLRCGLLGLLLLLGGVAHAQGVTPSTSKPDRSKLSYALGYQIGSQLADGKPDVAVPIMVRAIEDAYAKRQPTVSMQDMHQQLQLLNQQMRAEAQAEFQRVAAANARKSEAYLAQNRQQPGVVQLPSGIQYAVLHRGTSKISPKVTSTVTANYRGMLVDGTEFDSTWARGTPVRFTVNKVIRGWQDVIPRMHVGDRWKVVIPAQLAYGEAGALPRIGPNEALVFDIELLSIEPESAKP